MATFKAPKKAPQAGGAFLDKPGIYHMQIVHVDEQPQGNNQMLDGFKVQFSVLGGDEDGKQMDQLFNNPNEAHKDGGEFASQIQAAFFIGAGLITESDLDSEELDIDLQKAVSRQVIVEVRKKREKVDGKWTEGRFLEVAGPAVYHIDDPRTANVYKKISAINLLPKELRRDPKKFDMVRLTGKPDVVLLGESADKSTEKGKSNGKSASNGNGNGHSNGSNGSSQAKQPTVSEDDLSDL